MKRLLVIVADNDGDYVTEMNEITPEQLEELLPVFEAIKNFKPYKATSEGGSPWTHSHNWPKGSGEYVPRKDLGEKSPYGEYGIHTIKTIKVLNVESETSYYEHRY